MPKATSTMPFHNLTFIDDIVTLHHVEERWRDCLKRIRRQAQEADLESGKITEEDSRDKHDIARCTVERLMREHGLRGVTRGKKKTTIPDPAQSCPDDKVNRPFIADAPNQLWVSDLTYLSTWTGMVYVAFVMDVFARKIVGWCVSTLMTTGFVLDALNQSICHLHQRDVATTG